MYCHSSLNASSATAQGQEHSLGTKSFQCVKSKQVYYLDASSIILNFGLSTMIFIFIRYQCLIFAMTFFLIIVNVCMNLQVFPLTVKVVLISSSDKRTLTFLSPIFLDRWQQAIIKIIDSRKCECTKQSNYALTSQIMH